MKWFQVDSDAPDDPRIRDVVRALGPEGIGGLFLLWCHIANHGAKRPGWSLRTDGKPMPEAELQDASGLSAEKFATLIAICSENGHFLKREWVRRKVIAIPAMDRRADTYTKRRVRTTVEEPSTNVPLQDKTVQDIPVQKERGRSLRPPAVPGENRKVITRLVRILRAKHPTSNYADLKEAVKRECAHLHIAYDADVVGKAIDSALSKGLSHASH